MCLPFNDDDSTKRIIERASIFLNFFGFQPYIEGVTTSEDQMIMFKSAK